MSNIFDKEKYLYAENLQGKRVKLTIKKIVGGIDFHSPAGKKKGFDIYFDKTDKILGVTGITVKRQLFMATGTEETDEMVGKEITLYAVKSIKSATGLAIRIAVPEQNA